MSNMSAETFSTCKLLDVRGLRVSFDAVDVLHGVDLTVHCGRIHALIGESGSGKSVLARSILGLAGRGARTTGSIRFLGRELVGLSEREYRAIRGADIGLVVQDTMSALNPMRTIGEQLVETIACRHPDFRSGASRASRSSRADRHDIALELLRTVGITAPEKRMNAYAHQLSGGMRQRVMIALALTGSPRLLLADEPTTALDVVVQRELLQEMRALVQARGMSMLIVTHDLNLARDVADDVSVMYAGHVLEEGPVSDVITRPAHPYTEGLLRAMPAMDGTRGRLIPIKGEIPPPDKLGSGCPFASRCPRVTNACRESLGAMTAVEDGRRRTRCDAALLTAAPHAPSCASRLASLPVQDTEFPVISDIRIARHCYVSRQGLLGRRRPWDVLQDIDLQVRSGEVMGLVGESGCGKSTLARLALGLIEPTEGTVRFKNAPIPERGSAAWRAQRASMQPKISDFGAVDDEGKRSISLWHKQTPGIPGVDFHLERLYNILQSWRFQKWPIRTQKPPSRNVPTRTKLKGCLPMRSTSSVRALGMFTFPIASVRTGSASRSETTSAPCRLMERSFCRTCTTFRMNLTSIIARSSAGRAPSCASAHSKSSMQTRSRRSLRASLWTLNSIAISSFPLAQRRFVLPS